MKPLILLNVLSSLAVSLPTLANYRQYRSHTRYTEEQLKQAYEEAEREKISWPHPDFPTYIYSVTKGGYLSFDFMEDVFLIHKMFDRSDEWMFETDMIYPGIFTIRRVSTDTEDYALRLVEKRDRIIITDATREEAAKMIIKICGYEFRLKLVSGLYISATGEKDNMKLSLVEDEGCMQLDEATARVNIMRRPDTVFMLYQIQPEP